MSISLMKTTDGGKSMSSFANNSFAIFADLNYFFENFFHDNVVHILKYFEKYGEEE